MTTYTIERLLEKQILNELYLDAFAAKYEGGDKKIEELIEFSMSNSIDQLDDIVELFYDKYPDIEGHVIVSELIDYFLDLIDNETLKKFGVDEYAAYAELVAATVVNFVERYNEIAAGLV